MIVDRGVDAIHELPEDIKKDKIAVAETVENNVRKLIIDESPTNPKYYEKMSILLDELIKEIKTQLKDYTEFLAKIVELAKKVKNPGNSKTYPSSLNSNARRALYDNLDHDESLALAVDREIVGTKKDAWRSNKIKEREVKNAIIKHIQDETLVETIFELVKNQNDY